MMDHRVLFIYIGDEADAVAFLKSSSFFNIFQRFVLCFVSLSGGFSFDTILGYSFFFFDHFPFRMERIGASFLVFIHLWHEMDYVYLFLAPISFVWGIAIHGKEVWGLNVRDEFWARGLDMRKYYYVVSSVHWRDTRRGSVSGIEVERKGVAFLHNIFILEIRYLLQSSIYLFVYFVVCL
ncbi:hypothetical protein EYC80_004393 [Monilinia laxa]|uniref:Uncharacterized protein n=1 Tax=Monilinia laxa TaxID=61186 RepID=A0A5N6KMW6_MONLA|nr:hypothetical protein EYC80_004393 [Monilinia laxa]